MQRSLDGRSGMEYSHMCINRIQEYRALLMSVGIACFWRGHRREELIVSKEPRWLDFASPCRTGRTGPARLVCLSFMRRAPPQGTTSTAVARG